MAKINSFFVNDLGMESSEYDPCFFVLRRDSGTLMICLYVDDTLIAGSSLELVKKVKSELAQRFEK